MKQPFKKISLFVFTAFFVSMMHAQTVDNKYKGSYSPKVEKDNKINDWYIGAGLNIVKDNGGFSEFFKGQNYHFTSPFYINAEYMANTNFSFALGASFNKYKEGKVVDGITIATGSEASYMAVDFATKLYFRDVFKTFKIEPYIAAGFGNTSIGSYTSSTGTDIAKFNSMTFNAGGGGNLWLSKYIGLHADVMGKLGFKNSVNGISKNAHIQFSFGLVYCLNTRTAWRDYYKQ